MTQLNLYPVPRVYVAGPIHGSGHMTSNLYNALTAGNMLREAGCIPFIPHLFLLWELLRNDPDDQEFWLEMDETWLAQCHALVRIDGVSPGADREVAFAKARGIPVFDSSGVTGAAVTDVFTGVRRFIGEYKSGRFMRHLYEREMHETDVESNPYLALTEMRARIDRIAGRAFASDTERLNFLERAMRLQRGYGLDLLQQEVSDWLDRQPFGPGQTPDEPYMGIVEEVGELSHARLKARQGIRGSAEHHAEKEMDALGDMIIYMCGYAKARGFRLQECVERAWSEVSKRDWGANRETGVSRAAPTVAPGPKDLVHAVREVNDCLDAVQAEVQKAEAKSPGPYSGT